MATSTSPKITAANIPNITALRNELDYGDSRLPRCAAFYDDTRAFRKKFITSRGVAGTDLHDWRSRDGQAGLTEMTLAYLDKEGNGPMFWPDDKSSSKYNKYQYSKHHPRIKRLVKQLFFRLNQQQFRNTKYKHKGSSEIKPETRPEPKPADNRGLSEQTAIDLDAIEEGQTISTATRVNEPPLASVSATAQLSELCGGQHPSPGRVILDDTDIYAVPPSPPRMRQFESVNRPSGLKRGSAFADSFAQARQPKRQRQPGSSAKDANPSITDSTGQTWTSPRARRTVQREGYLGLDGMTEAIDWVEGIDPGLDMPNPPQQASPRGGLAIIVRAPNDTIDDSAYPDQSQEESRSSAALAPPSPPRFDLGKGNSPVQDQVHPEPIVYTAPTLSDTGHLRDHGRESEQPEPSPLHPSTSPTPGPAGGAGRGTSEEGGGAKFSINFIYRVVLSRTHKTVTERWAPQGRFQDKTLAELLKELPFPGEECQGLIFTIVSSCMETVERIPNGDEDGFASMKRYINMEIREWLARQRRLEVQTAPRLVVDIIIERMSDEKKQQLDELEDVELDW